MSAGLKAPMTEELVWANVMRPRVPLVYLDLNTIIYFARGRRDGFLAGTIRLEAPDVCRWELGNVLRKIATRFELTEQQVVQSVSDLDGLGVVIHPTSVDDLTVVARLAVRHSLSLFDAAFVSLALRTGLPLLTTDARLVRAVGGLILPNCSAE